MTPQELKKTIANLNQKAAKAMGRGDWESFDIIVDRMIELQNQQGCEEIVLPAGA
ncbi:MAG: hypothetical protein GOVbin1773_3 [Prokaryotic dsDNA virus sp.]|jgi:D-alanine-D-alanine ligase-like ATP-grasp enzyme|nr:MAG: hypothetical protein GOVbin1773_3 [Prokaryotic dsDNA virus sp.]|tara:strand:- start:344 stop:508 length:165 start_codon:yes stop_codon:yes gene_type:complete